MDLFSLIGNFSPLGHEDSSRHYNDIYYTQQVQPHHRASWTHEAIAGAAGFAAMHAYESHLRATGQQPSHAVMKEILAGIAAAEVDKLVETKGLDWIDAHKARKMAAHQAHHLANQRYAGGTGWEYASQQQGPNMAYNYGGGAPFAFAGPYGGGGYGGGGYGGYGGQPGYPQPGYGGGYGAPGGYGLPPGPPPPMGYGNAYNTPGYGDPAAFYAQQNQGQGHHHRHHHHQG